MTLSGSYTGASTSPAEVGFYWGTSSNSLTNKLTVSSVTATGTDSGTFEAHLSDLVPGKSYVFQAFARVSGTGAYSSDEQVFYAGTPTVFKMPGGAQPAVDKDWLELASAKEGSQYVVSTTYAGERNYTVFYDTQMTTPLWTAYPLDSSHMGSLSRPSGWSYNPNIDEKYQVRVTDGSYSNSTYSRGHMCPNGSRNGNATMQAQTFYVTNQVPQIQAIIQASAETKSPVILQVSKGARNYANQTLLRYMAEGAVEYAKELGWEHPQIVLHLDHGDSFELCKSCVDMGFSSVMIDGSSLPYEDNIALTKKVVEYAHKYDVTVEAELGVLAGVEDEVASEESHYTKPEEVIDFATRTGCDSLAISIGT